MSERVEYLFIAVFDDEGSADGVAAAIGQAAKESRVHVDGLAAIHRDTHGKVHIHEIGDITGSQGAVRGGLAGAAIGLVFPPAILASAVAGGLIGSLVAKFHDTGFKTGELHSLGEELGTGQSAVLFVGNQSTEAALSDELKEAKKVKQEELTPELKDHMAGSAGAGEEVEAAPES